MTSERDFDRLARAWLEQGPDEAPDRVVAAVLQAAETMPQARRRIGWPTWRPFQMNRLPVAAGAVAILVVAIGGGVIIAGNRGPSAVTNPSPTSVPSASAPSVPIPIPAELQSTWVGAPRSIPSFVPAYRYRFELTRDAFRFPLDDLRQGQLQADATIADGNVLVLTSTDTSGGCQVGDVGRYTWNRSTSGTRLTVTLVDDGCAARQTALPGDWRRVACKDVADGCLGDLVEAGTYPSQYFTPRLVAGSPWSPQWGALTYTVPAGWANAADWPNRFVLTPSDAYALEGPTGPPDGGLREIGAYRLPFAIGQDAGCTDAAVSGVPTTMDGLIGYIRGLKSVISSTPASMTVDGHPAKWIDLKVAPSWTKTCPDLPNGEPLAVLLGSGDTSGDQNSIGISGTERERLVFVDVGGQVALVVIDSSDPTRFDDLVAQAMTIIESFRFK